ncbi:MAG: EFR1 family ferrodoxin [Oscillospiraceae bacterium]
MTTIYYFTGTGNSLMIAKEIAKALPDCELVSIAKAIDTDAVCTSDIIGFVHPVYVSNLPNMVEHFVRKLTFNPTAYIFSVAVCGASSGNALPLLQSILEEKGAKLSYSVVHQMPANYVVLYNIDIDKVDGILENSDKEIPKIIEDIRSKVTNEVPPMKKTFLTGYLNKLRDGYPASDRNFVINNSCTGCGTCASICPANNIEMFDGKPTFKHKCEHCMACLHWCPNKAIDYKKKTQKRNRYHNPRIQLSEMIIKRL